MLEVVNTAENGVCISGFGYDSSLVDEHLELDKDLLDSVSKTNPLFVVNQSEHLAYLDSEAYKRTSIDDSTTDPHYFKRDGKLTGVVAEANWTSCLISSSHPFREICCLGWRISGKLDGQTKRFNQGFTAAVNEPYLDYEDNSYWTLDYPTSDVLYKAIRPWLHEGWQIIIHCNGDRAADQVLEVYDTLFKKYPDRDLSIMHRIEHLTVTNKPQVEQTKDLGLGTGHTSTPWATYTITVKYYRVFDGFRDS
ncbi:hypothetical protein MMC12_001578 [Toensbergia leucococca]|nr:hypothetical protein [Toensbergia leucococca]